MLHQAGRWYSEFPPKKGRRIPITQNQSVAVLTSNHNVLGHAAIYLEEIDLTTGQGRLYKLELTQDDGQVFVDLEPREAHSSLRQFNIPRYKSWIITHNQGDALLQAAMRYKTKVGQGRYQYCLPGGAIGHLKTLHKPRTGNSTGKHAVNCADFAMKILREAGIATITSGLFNRPAGIAKGHH